MLFSPSSLKKETLCKVAGLLILNFYSFWALGAAAESIGEYLFMGKGGCVLKCGQKKSHGLILCHIILSLYYSFFILLD